MLEQKIKTSLKQKLLMLMEIIIVLLLTIFLGTFMAFYYDELGLIPTTILIILTVVLFLPKFLRRNFNTDKNRNLEVVKSLDYQNKIGSFIWTRPDKNGFFLYREFITGFSKSSIDKLQGNVYYIDFKAKCLIAVIQILHIVSLPFIFVYITKIENPIISIFVISIFAILFINSYDRTRNFIIRKLAKDINPSKN